MKNETFKKKTVNTKNMELSYILRTAVGSKNMENLADYDIQVVATDAELAGKIDEKFAEAGASGVKTSYLEPIAPLPPKTYRPPVRKMVAHVAPAKEEAVAEETVAEAAEEAPVEEVAPEVVEEVAPEVVEEVAPEVVEEAATEAPVEE